MPDYFIIVIERLLKRDWIIHNFEEISNSEIYNPLGFLENNQIEYRLYLDLNIYQYILNSVKKDSNKEEFKDAIALLIFCQICKIEVDPSLAIYEKVNYKYDNKLDEIIDELNIFEILNNTNPDLLILYVTDDKKMKIENKQKINRLYVKQRITKYSVLKEWKSIYLMVLVICDISSQQVNSKKKLIDFVGWMSYKYRFSFILIIYAAIFFGKKPFGKMMKFKFTDSKENKRKSIINMTWDLYLLDRYFKMWSDDKNLNKELLFASADKAFIKLLRIGIDCQKNHSLNALSKHIDFDTLNLLKEITINTKNRIYLSEDWTIQYRDSLIKEYEKKLNILF